MNSAFLAFFLSIQTLHIHPNRKKKIVIFEKMTQSNQQVSRSSLVRPTASAYPVEVNNSFISQQISDKNLAVRTHQQQKQQVLDLF